MVLVFLVVWVAGTMYFLRYNHQEGHKNKNSSTRTANQIFNQEEYLKDQDISDDPYQRHAFNVQASNMLAVNRLIPDTRSARCQVESYPDQLPQISVIIVFHNEARSTLLRTVMSVLNRSPPELLKEIILVDDFSDNVNDGLLLAKIPKVIALRNNERQGLIRSRVAVVSNTSAEVLVFLDSHCEVNTGWLEPLVLRIKQVPNAVVSPVLDVINMDTFEYEKADENLRGGHQCFQVACLQSVKNGSLN